VTCYIPRWFTYPQAVTHPSTNRAHCRLTTLIEANALTTTLRRHSTLTLLWTGTREAAFVHAISSAGVVYAVTRACSSGQLDRCGCDRSITTRSPPSKHRRRTRSGRGTTLDTGRFQWSGCSDNIAYGVAFAKSFIDAGERSGRNRSARSDRAVINLHNNNAGRKASMIGSYT